MFAVAAWIGRRSAKDRLDGTSRRNWRRSLGRNGARSLVESGRRKSVDLSPYSARVRMQIYAKGLSDIVIERPADWGTPKFRERLPIGRIPVLDVDGDLMPESAVIAEYLEEVYPQPSLLGETARETAHIRTLARLSDIYLINSIFVLWPQALASNRNEGIVELFGGHVVRNIKALDRMVGSDGFACCVA
ncbi:MAG TPA: glutathione S-transferase N-terminal domain-containing protein [Caulobacteraceae bacterium]|nr:glutathione S-transferase N-terminal domain-containing protein [Caulobacteraceae bacterium]